LLRRSQCCGRNPEPTSSLGAARRSCKALSRAGLVDEYRLVVNPVALGDGLPLFKDLSAPIKLQLVEATTYATASRRRRRARGPVLRALDAIHLVAAIDLSPIDAFVSYDDARAQPPDWPVCARSSLGSDRHRNAL
jgi:hypothetical protein